jgi:molybdopterin-guanine dinucleotide biosynthesis protein A
MNEDITGIILCGGKSKRMGVDKSFLKIDDKPMIERVYEMMSNNFKNVLLISNESQNYYYLSKNVYKDIYPGLGPLSGIHSGLKYSKSQLNFFISSDMPFVTEDVILFLLRHISSHDIVLSRSNNFINTICGIYSKNCLDKAEDFLKKSVPNQKGKKNRIKLRDLIHACNTLVLDIEEQFFFNADLMFNMNSYEDYLYAKSKLET